MSNTLVIHPHDNSTQALVHIYMNKGFDVITDPNISRKELKNAIKNHDRIIMLGHGTPLGLVHPDVQKYGRVLKRGRKPFIIDDSFANLLREKETISIWCYSNQYFKRNNIYILNYFYYY